MKHLSVAAVLSVSLLFTAGCFPVRFTRSPGVSGVVLDAQTRAPVVGARASMCHRGARIPATITESNIHAIDRRRAVVAADGQGRFCVPPLRAWTTWNPFWFPLEDMKEGSGILMICREGYEPKAVEVQTVRKKRVLTTPVLLHPRAQ